LKLAENFILKVNTIEEIILGHLTYAAARLYNIGNYQRHNWTKESGQDYPDWYKQKKELKNEFWYKNLPSQTAQETLKILADNWKSYYCSIKEYRKNPEKFTDKPQSPHYKTKGSKFNIRYLNNGFKINNNKIRLSIPRQLKNYLKEEYSITQNYLWLKVPEELLSSTRNILKNTCRIEIKPVDDTVYKIILIYKVDIPEIKEDNNKYLAIDLGINNLMSCYDNNNQECFIIDGGQYLSINRYFDKKIKNYQSIINAQGKKTSKRIQQLYSKRRKQLFHLIHTATKKITDYCLDHDISRVVVGDIKGIRDSSNLGKCNNQKLHKLPFEKIYHQLEYKLKLHGILLIKQNESYTSRCSPYAPEVCKKYAARKNRIYRGFYMDREKKKAFNADIVGAYNILRKYLHKENQINVVEWKPERLNEVTKYKWNRHKFCA